ncbi:MAG TPA: winged helix DNA-binding domain-containing protein [Pyrinomonadaceae bacterium]|nr:winged helix DNA-binding domain-containing protein [Pyrinomonadaceae bacterium]
MSTAKQKEAAVVAERLRNHKLSSSDFKQPADVVRWFGAVQAQEFHAAKWALALRMSHATNVAVEDAFNRGEILRTHLLRPTWHFVTPEDIRWLLQLTGPRVNVRCSSVYRQYELDEPVLKRSNRALTNALKGGKQLTRVELRAALNRAGIPADDGVRLAHILLRAELDGVVCSGPRRGNQFTYALLEERVGQSQELNGEEALAELTRRYFASHGPATLADFVWWSGLTTNDARRGIALLDSDVERFEIGENVYWSSGFATKRSRDIDAYLLPAYDEYNVAYKNRQVVFDQDSVPQITTWGALGPTVVVDGRITGIWKTTGNENSITITVTPSRHLRKHEKLAIAKAAQRYAAFLGSDLRMSWS